MLCLYFSFVLYFVSEFDLILIIVWYFVVYYVCCLLLLICFVLFNFLLMCFYVLWYLNKYCLNVYVWLCGLLLDSGEWLMLIVGIV